MLSADLVNKYSRFIFLGKEKKFVSPEEVYMASSLAQSEILRDLRLLQDKTTIIFPSVETCQRQPRIVSTIAGTTTVTVTTTVAHGYQTGEEYIIYGVLGITGVNGRWTITVTSTTAFTLNGATGASTYTSGGTVYPLINSIVDLIGGRQTSPNDFPMTRVDYDQVNNDREEFGTSSPADSVFRMYQLETDPITIGVQGTPDSTVNVETRFYRVPLPNEDISDVINPIVPDKYKRLLELGTLCYIYEDMDDMEAITLAEKQRTLFEREKQRVQGSVMKSRIRGNAVPRGLNW
jgi:hypothetical protein